MKHAAIGQVLLLAYLASPSHGSAAGSLNVSGTATVTLSKPSGVPQHLASGMIYGIPAKPNQVPAEFYTGMGFRWNLAGAAQTNTTGWIGGVHDFNVRFEDTFGEYSTTVEHGGEFQLRISDLWGADGTEASTVHFPGDNGNWTSYYMFLDAIVESISKKNMRGGLSVEIWNEPEYFWKRSESQYFEMWKHGVPRLRELFGPDIPLLGPSFSTPPGTPGFWWDAYLAYIRQHNIIPDIFTWHAEVPSSNPYDDPQEAAAAITSMLQQHNIPPHPYCINEYGDFDEQQPAGVAWFISRLERLNIPGLRGNYVDGPALHDYLANLLGKPGAGTAEYNYTQGGYWPNGEWRVYQYYAQQMTGYRVATEPSPDRLFDVYATSDGSPSGVKILCGPRVVNGTWAITVDGLSHVGHKQTGSVLIRTLRFDWNGIYGYVGLPVDMGVTEHQYKGDSLTFTVTPATDQTAYAFEFSGDRLLD